MQDLVENAAALQDKMLVLVGKQIDHVACDLPLLLCVCVRMTQCLC